MFAPFYQYIDNSLFSAINRNFIFARHSHVASDICHLPASQVVSSIHSPGPKGTHQGELATGQCQTLHNHAFWGWVVGLQVNRLRDRSYTWGSIHFEIHLVNPGYPWPNVAFVDLNAILWGCKCFGGLTEN